MSDGEVELPVKDEEELLIDGATCATFCLFFEDFSLFEDFFGSVGRLGDVPLFLDLPETVLEELFPLGFLSDFEVFLLSNGTSVVLGRALSTVMLSISFSWEEELGLLLATFAPAGVLASIEVVLSRVVSTVVLTSPCSEELKLSTFVPAGMQPSATKGVLRRALSTSVSRNG